MDAPVPKLYRNRLFKKYLKMDQIIWKKKNIYKHKNIKVHYWILKEYQLVTIHRNRDWFNSILYPALQNTWEFVENFIEDDDSFKKESEKRKDKRDKRNITKNTQFTDFVFRDK